MLREELLRKNEVLRKSEDILGKNRQEAKELLRYFFDDEIMAEKKYEIRMSQAKQIQNFLLTISKLKMT